MPLLSPDAMIKKPGIWSFEHLKNKATGLLGPNQQMGLLGNPMFAAGIGLLSETSKPFGGDPAAAVMGGIAGAQQNKQAQDDRERIAQLRKELSELLRQLGQKQGTGASIAPVGPVGPPTPSADPLATPAGPVGPPTPSADPLATPAGPVDPTSELAFPPSAFEGIVNPPSQQTVPPGASPMAGFTGGGNLNPPIPFGGGLAMPSPTMPVMAPDPYKGANVTIGDVPSGPDRTVMGTYPFITPEQQYAEALRRLQLPRGTNNFGLL